MKLVFTTLIILGFLHANAQKSEVYTTAGKAINGYDPVAFFTASRPMKGADSLSYQWKGATWLFSNKDNMNAFKSSPEKYAPQYGGYCAYGTADGHKAPTQIDTWTIADDKLYFNYNSKVKEMWTKDQKNLIMKADANWPALKNKE
ncbi:hypothetical protein SAMN05428988_4446 [Chitinophaga sp. YR573]|uniref:YHS domain-containing (seleno)protein n=1 Tax=Chitinophaga sp. YR573 TaxID=1881040 RepID=UPI0008BC9A6F|nr:YHS domain-containing (seleno)protein [Chitinophaga sp. YR573]SEW36115.1 hypothetical protein SAMN05428988_4446 [Chitinophaga sp. YR573]